MTYLNRWTPSPEFKNFQIQLNRLFEPFSGNFVPSVDIAETQEKILVRAELPGMQQEDIEIEFENGLLTLRGERNFQKEEGVNWHRVERTYGSFSRSFTLPRTVDAERISASYRDGVLEIEVPKKEEAKPKQIRIEVK